MASDDQRGTSQEKILERLSTSLRGLALGSEASPEVTGSDSAETSGSVATPTDRETDARFDWVLDQFHHTFCNYFSSMPVFKRVGSDAVRFYVACRFVLSRAPPLLPDFPDLPDLMEEAVSELRNLSLELYMEIERAKGLKMKCLGHMEAVHQAYLDGAFSFDERKNLEKLFDEATTIMSFINALIGQNRRRIQYFFALRCLILSHFCPN